MKLADTVDRLAPKIKITVFQALTILAEAYRDDVPKRRIYRKILSLYLSGVRTLDDHGVLEFLLEDPLLSNYIVSASRKDINEDPVRRYFESHLSHKTLTRSLDFLDIDELTLHLNSILDRIPIEYRDKIINRINNNQAKRSINEYSEGIRTLSKSDSYQSLKPETQTGSISPEIILDKRKKKLGLITQCTYAAMYVNEVSESGEVLLDIYHKRGSIYASHNRGRVPREDPITQMPQEVFPHTLGIMRSYMPLPINDALFSEKPTNFIRPADTHTFAQASCQRPNETFINKVTPFVNSISGTMLIKLRVIAQLMESQQFVYQKSGNYSAVDAEQLQHYFTSLISYMLYHAGGHSLDEFVSVLQLPEVQAQFEHIPEFSGFTLNGLFKDNNHEAFDEALCQTIVYNRTLITKKRMHGDIKTSITLRAMMQQNQKPNTPSASKIGTLTVRGSTYSINDPSIISGTFLFALIRLLNDSPKPTHKRTELMQYIKQLFLISCLVAIVKLIGATVIKESAEDGARIKKTMHRFSPYITSISQALIDYSVFQTPKPRHADQINNPRHGQTSGDLRGKHA